MTPDVAAARELCEEIAVVIEKAHAPQTVGSHERALWIADAILPIVFAQSAAGADEGRAEGLHAGAHLLMALKAECEKQHARAETAYAAGAATERERLGPWINHTDECCAWMAANEQLHMDMCTCGLQPVAPPEEPR